MASVDQREAIRPLVRSVVGRDGPEPFGVYCFAGTDPAAEIARFLEREVFDEAFGNSPELLAAEYGAYEATSLFCCIIDRRRALPVGMIRLIVPTPGGPGLKSWNDVERFWDEGPEALAERNGVPIDAAHCWDYATLAVAKDFRTPFASGFVSLALYQSSIRGAASRGMDGLVAILDRPVYRMSRLRYSEAFVAYGPHRPYLGSEASFPVILDLDRWEHRLDDQDPAMHRIMYCGLGIEAAVRPLDLEHMHQLADSIGAPRRPDLLIDRALERSGPGRGDRGRATVLSRYGPEQLDNIWEEIGANRV